jgi:hypothetical protein
MTKEILMTNLKRYNTLAIEVFVIRHSDFIIPTHFTLMFFRK